MPIAPSIRTGHLVVRSARQLPSLPPAPPRPPFAVQPLAADVHEIRFAGESAVLTVCMEYAAAEQFAFLYHRIFRAPQAPLRSCRLSESERLDLIEALQVALHADA